MTKRVFAYQIYYDDESRASLDPSFLPLDNSDNTRPDWREYWPMRSFLLSNQLEEDAYYGFLSPKFQQKTGLTGQQVADFVESHEADVYIFSPYVEQSTFFLNIFEQGEANHPGFRNAMQQFVAAVGLPGELHMAVCDLNNSIYSNYFLAKPVFWRQWLQIAEALFAIAESGHGELAAALNGAAKYHENVGLVAFKVFLMERLATLVLLLNQYVTAAYDPFALTRTGIPASYLDHEMRIANALKMAFIRTGDGRYIESFIQFRNQVMANL